MQFPTYVGNREYLVSMPSIAEDASPIEEALVRLTYLNGGMEDIYFGNRKQVSASWEFINLSREEYAPLYHWAVSQVGERLSVLQGEGEYVFGPAFGQDNLVIQIKGVNPIGETAFTEDREMFSLGFTAILLEADGVPVQDDTKPAYEFLVEVEVNAISTDYGKFATLVDLQSAHPTAELGETALVEENDGSYPSGMTIVRIVYMWDGASWEKHPALRAKDVTYFQDDKPVQVSSLRHGQDWAKPGALEYAKYLATSEGSGGWSTQPYKPLGRFRPVVANVEDLSFRGSVFRFSSFADWEDPDWTPTSNVPQYFKAGFIAKDGVNFPTMSTSLDQGPSVEHLNGFSVALDNSKRFHWQTLGFNFFGAICRLYVVDLTGETPRKVLVRTGINTTNSLDFSNYKFSVDPSLFSVQSAQAPTTTVQGSDVFAIYDEDAASTLVPMTYGQHPHALAIPTVRSETVLTLTDSSAVQHNAFQLTSFTHEDVVGESIIEFKCFIEQNTWDDYFEYQTGADLRQVMFNQLSNGRTWFVKFLGYDTLVPIYGPRTTYTSSYGFKVKEALLPATPEELKGNYATLYSIDIVYVVDDHVCEGIGENLYPAVKIFDSNINEFVDLPVGIFKELPYKNGFFIDMSNPALKIHSFDNVTIFVNIPSGKFLNKNIAQTVTACQDGSDEHGMGSPGHGIIPLHSPYMRIYEVIPNQDAIDIGADPHKFYKVYRSQYETDTVKVVALQDLTSNYSWLPRAVNHKDYTDTVSGVQFGSLGMQIPSIFWHGSWVDNASYTRMVRTADHWRSLITTMFPTVSSRDINTEVGRGTYHNLMASNRKYTDGLALCGQTVTAALYYPLTSDMKDKLRGASNVRILAGLLFSVFNPGQRYYIDGRNFMVGACPPVTLTVTLVHGTDRTKNIVINGEGEGQLFDNYAAGAGLPQMYCQAGAPYILNNLPSALGGRDDFYNFGESTSVDASTQPFIVEDDELAVPYGMVGPNPVGFDGGNSKLPKYAVWSGRDLFGIIPDYLFDVDAGFQLKEYVGIRFEFSERNDQNLADTRVFKLPTYGIRAHCGTDFVHGIDDVIYLQKEIDLAIDGSDELFVAVKGRNNTTIDGSVADPNVYETPAEVMQDVVANLAPQVKFGGHNIPNMDNFKIRAQFSESIDLMSIMEDITKHAWAVTSIDETDGIFMKSIDYEDYTESDIVFHFDESNVIREESIEVKYRKYEDIVRKYTFKFEKNDSTGDLEKVVITQIDEDYKVEVDGFDPTLIPVLMPYYFSRLSIGSGIEVDMQNKFERSKTYYDSGKDNEAVIEFPMASDYDNLSEFGMTPLMQATQTNANDQVVSTAGWLMKKAMQFSLFNSWTVSFRVHMKYLIGAEDTPGGGIRRLAIGDYIELKTWFHADNNPIRGFVKAIDPDLYNGIVKITLFCPVPPDVYKLFYDNIWDGGIIMPWYDASKRVIDPINQYPFRGTGAGEGEYPDGGIIGPPYDPTEFTFTDDSYADADDPNTPF